MNVLNAKNKNEYVEGCLTKKKEKILNEMKMMMKTMNFAAGDQDEDDDKIGNKWYLQMSF